MFRNIFLGFIKLHILYHGGQSPVFGLGLLSELETHGYQLSPGTLYPILHALERDGFLVCEKKIVNGKLRKYYTTTESGAAVLAEAYAKAHELLDEIQPK